MNSHECPATKTCGECGETKSITNFYFRSNRSGSRIPKSICKSCDNRLSANRFAHNKSKRLEKCAEYRRDNAERIAEYMRNYYAKHKAEIVSKSKAYQQQPHRKAADSERQKRRYLEVRETRNAEIAKRREQDEAFRQDLITRAKEHYKANKAEYVARRAKRRAAEIKATPKWSNHKMMLPFYRVAERLTRETGIQHAVDHIVPLQGRLVCGLHVAHNLRVITAKENLRKSNKHFG